MTGPRFSASTTSTANSATIVLTLSQAVLAGEHVVVGINRASVSGVNNGATLTDSGSGNSWSRVSAACRASTHDLELFLCTATNGISSGGTITATWANVNTRKAMVISVWDDLTGTLGNNSGNTVGDGVTGTPANGSGTVETASCASTALTHFYVIGAATYGGTTTIAATSGSTEIAQNKTTTGSSDRGLILLYREYSAAGTGAISGTASATGGWAATSAQFQVDDTPPAGGLASVVVSGAKKTVTSTSVIVGGVKKTVTSVSVIVGGVKKAVS